MTAIPDRRKRRTWFGLVASVVLVAVAAMLFVVGVITLSNSEEGEAVGIDERPVVALPATPNAVLAAVDRNGRLASVVIMTLLPDGQGGSIVTLPVNADVTAGFGEERQSLSEVFDADDPQSLVEPLEEILTLTIERSAVVGVDELIDLLEPVEMLRVDLPEDVIDSSLPGSGIVTTAGDQTLRRLLVAQALVAINDGGRSYEHHAVDVEIWSELANTAPSPIPPPEVEADEFGRPIPPGSAEELVRLLWEGNIEVRDLAVTAVFESDNPSEVDVVSVDRKDAILVFGQVSPGLVSTPNPAMSFRIEAPFSDAQLEAAGGVYGSSSELMTEMIGELLFFEANVVSVDTAPTSNGATEVTLIEVADERFVEDMEAAGPVFFGESEVVVSSTVLDGVDAVVTLGTGYLDRREEIAEIESDDLAEDELIEDGLEEDENVEDTVVEPDE